MYMLEQQVPKCPDTQVQVQVQVKDLSRDTQLSTLDQLGINLERHRSRGLSMAYARTTCR